MALKQAFSPDPTPIALPITKQQAVYRYLKNQIMRMQIPPGQRVVIDEVASKLGLSAIPVREALQFLQSEGLVQIRPHAGATVSPITALDIAETFTILEGVEAMAVRCICANPSADLLKFLKQLLKQMDGALAQKNVESWSELNVEFHLCLARETGMPRLLDITERALSDWDRIRSYYFRGGAPHRMDDAQREHHQLFQAISKGNASRGEKLIRQHNQKALSHYLAAIPRDIESL